MILTAIIFIVFLTTGIIFSLFVEILFIYSSTKKLVGLFFLSKTGISKYLFEIPVSLLGTEMMTITRYSKTPAGGGIFGGEEINRQVVRWEKGLNHNLLLRSVTLEVSHPPIS